MFGSFIDSLQLPLYHILVQTPLFLIDMFYNLFGIVFGAFANVPFGITVDAAGNISFSWSWNNPITQVYIIVLIIAFICFAIYFIFFLINLQKMHSSGKTLFHQLRWPLMMIVAFVGFPIAMILGNYLLQIVLTLFSGNSYLVLTDADIMQIKNQLIPMINQLDNIKNITINVNGTTMTLYQALVDINYTIDNLIIRATDANNQQLIDYFVAIQATVDQLLNYINVEIPKMINEINNILYSLTPGKIDYDQFQLLRDYCTELQNMSTTFFALDSLNELIQPYRSLIIGWHSDYELCLDQLNAISISINTFNNPLSPTTIGDYIGDGRQTDGLIDIIMYGNENTKGLLTVSTSLLGRKECDLTVLIFQVATGSNKTNWWMPPSIRWLRGEGNIIVGGILAWTSLIAMVAIVSCAVSRILLQFIYWIEAIFYCAKGDLGKENINIYFNKMIGLWWANATLLIFVEISMLIIPMFKNALIAGNFRGGIDQTVEIATCVMLQIFLWVSVFQSRRFGLNMGSGIKFNKQTLYAANANLSTTDYALQMQYIQSSKSKTKNVTQLIDSSNSRTPIAKTTTQQNQKSIWDEG